MKHLLTILLLLPLLSYGQADTCTSYTQDDSLTYVDELGTFTARSFILQPRHWANACKDSAGMIFYNPTDSSVYLFNGVDTVKIGGRGAGSGSVQSITAAGYMLGGTVSISGTFTPDTGAHKLATKTDLLQYQPAGMYLVPGDTANKWVPIGDSVDLTGYATLYRVDTAKANIRASIPSVAAYKLNTDSLIKSGYVTHYQDDTAKTRLTTAIAGKVNYTDTAAMLSNYLTSVLARVKYSDTSAMLANYLSAIAARVKYSDTSAMLSNYLSSILLRVKYSDTSAMLANYLSGILARVKYADTGAMLAPYLRTVNATTGTVTAVSITTANGVSGSSSGGATPALTITLGAIAPTSVNGVALVAVSSPTLTVTGATSVSGTHSGTSSGTNTGDQTITLTGDVTGSGTGSFATAIKASVSLTTPLLGTPTSGNLSNCTSIPAAQLTGSVTVANGGTGLSTLPAHAMLVGNGASNVTSLSPGTSANIVQSNGTDFVSNAMSGDVTIGSTGVTAIGSSKVTNGMLAGSIDLTSKVTGTLPVGNGGTGITSLGTGIATWWSTPSSANLAGALTDETGSGAAVFASGPALTNPTVGTQTAGDNSTKASSTAYVDYYQPQTNSTASYTTSMTPTSARATLTSTVFYDITAQAGALTINIPTGSWANHQKLRFSIRDNGTARALTFTTGTGGFNASTDLALPTTTVLSKGLELGFEYNSNTNKFVLMALLNNIP